jgi:hypothetical protein
MAHARILFCSDPAYPLLIFGSYPFAEQRNELLVERQDLFVVILFNTSASDDAIHCNGKDFTQSELKNYTIRNI